MYCFLYALIAPLILLPVETFLPFPYLIEEIGKYILVTILYNDTSCNLKNWFWLKIMILGVLFTFSESMLYVFNIIRAGNIWLFPDRLALTGLLHVGTITLMYLGYRKGRIWALATFLMSIAIHYTYNVLIIGSAGLP